MLATIAFAFVFMLVVVAAMAIGAMVHGRTIAGSCGGIGNLPGFEHPACTCKKPCDKRLKRLAEEKAAAGEARPLHFQRR